jgi:hypothetical protein
VTDKQRLNTLRRAREHLKKTVIGYHPAGGHWGEAELLLDALENDLLPKKLPAIGAVWKGGRSVLMQDLTHPTSGIPLYPAFDDAFVEGREVIAPEDLRVQKSSSSRPGDAFYATGASHIRYWFGHLLDAPPVGKTFKRGAVMGEVGPNQVGGGPHVHVGVNVELLFGKGKELEHNTNYTHGAPFVGAQLKKLLG